MSTNKKLSGKTSPTIPHEELRGTAFDDSNQSCAVGVQREIPLIEQVRNRRSVLSNTYTRQMEVLNHMEKVLQESDPEGSIAAIKERLSDLDKPWF